MNEYEPDFGYSEWMYMATNGMQRGGRSFFGRTEQPAKRSASSHGSPKRNKTRTKMANASRRKNRGK
jgi:hypothetical protein